MRHPPSVYRREVKSLPCMESQGRLLMFLRKAVK
jgi:hypothetical protein